MYTKNDSIFILSERVDIAYVINTIQMIGHWEVIDRPFKFRYLVLVKTEKSNALRLTDLALTELFIVLHNSTVLDAIILSTEQPKECYD